MCLAATATLQAFSEAEISLPSKPVSKSGLRLSVSSTWVETSGYRPVTITIDCPGGATSDRSFSVYLKPQGQYYYNDNQQVQLRTEIEMPQGSTWISKQVFFQQSYSWESLQIDTYEDGIRDDELSGMWSTSSTANQQGFWTEAYPGWLLIDADMTPTGRNRRRQPMGTTGRLPNLRNCSRLFPAYSSEANLLMEEMGQPRPTDDSILSRLNSLATVAMLPPSELPDNWIGYTCFDFIVISRDDLVSLQASEPQRWQALRRYLKSGAILVIYDAQNKLPELKPQVASMMTEDRLGEWKAPTERYGESLTDTVLPTLQNYGYGGGFVRRGEDRYYDEDTATETPAANTPQNKFATTTFGGGYIVAIECDPFEQQPEYWEWILRDLGESNWQWFRRNGFSLVRPNRDVWDLLIPGVGAAPVGMFLVLITLFVIVIGPVNYLLLSRWKRLYLMLLSVPLGAGIVTLGLLLFAVLGDGISTRTRQRSFTSLEDKDYTSWSRQTYYAGVAPSAGLTFDTQTAAFPVDYEPLGRRATGRSVDWGESQHLRQGYFRSRVTTSFAVNATGTPTPNLGLKITKVGDAAKTLRIENQLGVKLEAVVLKGFGEVYYFAESLGPDIQQLKPLEKLTVVDGVSRLVRANTPELPIGFQSNVSNRNRYYNYSWYISDQDLRVPTFDTSVLERQMARLSKLADEPPGTYFAITNFTPTTVPMGVSAARQEAGFHVIHGRWNLAEEATDSQEGK